MKLFSTIIIGLLTFHAALAQERKISGRLTSTEDGSPLPGVSITIKGTTTGTTTDSDGYYSLRVPIGSTLVFAFVGMQTREVVVTDTNLQPAHSRDRNHNVKRKSEKITISSIPRTFLLDSTFIKETGVAVLTNELPTYTYQRILDPTTIRSINHRGNRYFIKTDAEPIRRTGFGLQFSTSMGIEKINKLPSFQDLYSQGRTDGNNFQWNGADQVEVFSWGPLIRTLEFDGSSYPYDKNGRLVPSGTGNDEPAKRYTPESFFRTGFVNVNEIMILMPVPGNGTLIFDLENRTRSGIIPNSQHKKLNLTTSLKDYKIIDDIRTDASISFNRSTGDLVNRGANLTSIIGAVYRTPVTFDNSNALSPNSARNSSESYEFADGSKRSHAPGTADNPYGLINELPDNDELHRLMANANLQYSPSSPFNVVFNGSIDQQWNTSIFGTAPGYSGSLRGRLTNRKESQTYGNVILTTGYRYNYDGGELKLSLSYQADYSSRELNRMDGFNFQTNEPFGNPNDADSIITLDKRLYRRAQEVIVNAQYEYQDWLNIRFTNRNYFSNTISYNNDVNFFPTGSLSIDLANLIGSSYMDYFKVYSTVSRTIREAPLLYSNWSYGSSTLPVENYTNFYEANELFFTQNIAPETERKFETGLKIRHNRFSAELAYFNNLTKEFIVPINGANGTELHNAATIKNFGGTISAGYQGYITDGNWGVELRWSKYNSVVEHLYSSEEWIALAGFKSLQTVLAPDKPIGAIYGTSYVRTEDGKTVIGNDGFPLKNNNLTMIGNPIPDWNLGWSTFARWREFSFSFLFDVKKGGEVWNGTNSALDYLGVSENTENLRNTSNFVFEGVHVNDDPNVTPVDFYNPSNPLTENRWVRYGWDGVGEDYIEDASWIRLSELALSYTTKHRWHKSTIKSVKFSLIGRNLFLITPYTGVDPSATLFGYNTGNGIDLFNTPSTRSYNAQITIKI